MNEEIIGIEVSGEIYPIKDEETSGKAQTLETRVSTAEGNITNLETALTEQGRKLAQIETNIGETDIQELKSLVDTHEEEIKELTELIDDTTTSSVKTWSSEKIEKSLEDIEKETGDIYSEEEIVCGKWIDGRAVYRKCYKITLRVGLVIIDNIANIDVLLSCKGSYLSTSNNKLSIPWGRGESEYTNVLVDTLNNVKTASNITGTNCVIIIEYTKTSD